MSVKCHFVFAAALFLFSAVGIAEQENSEALKNPYEGREDVVPEGAGLFNQYCSHCHGPNAVQGERPRDLRRLKIRYGDILEDGKRWPHG
jgi:mono/diheme cytochrome c family protein